LIDAENVYCIQEIPYLHVDVEYTTSVINLTLLLCKQQYLLHKY